MRSRTRRLAWLTTVQAALVAGAALLVPVPAQAQGASDWPAYLFGNEHGSYNAAATAITTANAGSLSQVWHFTPPGHLGSQLYSTPIVFNGNVYFGSDNGNFYDLSESTGSVVWSHVTKQQPLLSCNWPEQPQGFVATATIAPDISSGQPTVYVAAPDGYLYAWNAADGNQLWKSVIAIPSKKVNDYFNWSSPTVANGRIFVGVASSCDTPLVRGGERSYSQASGQLLATFHSNPRGELGGDIWSSTLVTGDGSVYVDTGNQPPGGPIGRSDSIIRLDPQTLKAKDVFTVPAAQQVGDGDFGSSPVTWTADLGGVPTEMIGACNKNGIFYALRASTLASGPVWTDQLGSSSQQVHYLSLCSSSAVWDQTTTQLFLSGNLTTIGGTSFKGSVEQVDPATGVPTWQTGLPGAVLGTPTLDGSGVLAVATCDYSGAPNAVYLLNATDGQILATLSTGDTPVFGQPTFVDNHIFVASVGQGLLAYQPPTTSVIIPSDGATLSGTSATLDATAMNATSVEFWLFGGAYGYSGQLLCKATLTLYGWLCSWNTASVPNGPYLLLSEALNAGGNAVSANVNITVKN